MGKTNNYTLIGGTRVEKFPRTVESILAGIGTEYSCASFAIGCGEENFLSFCAGNRQDFSGDIKDYADPRAVTPDTLYDMASCSKMISTTMVALRMIEMGYFSPYDSIGRFAGDCGNFGGVEMRHLLTHSSGLTPHISLYSRGISPEDAVETILASTPVCGVGEDVHYSCMGYILLGKILEKLGGESLDRLAKEFVFEPLGMETACYNPKLAFPGFDDFAATEFSPHHKRYLSGEVHDENAHFLGGISGNAGVFASLDDCVKFAEMLSNRGKFRGEVYLGAHIFDFAVHNHTVGMNEARGYGFSLHNRELSASGELMSHDSYGHNGFTGTSIYIDGATGVYVVFLTNSVHYGRENRNPFFRHRRILHNIALSEYDRI